jgi:hypothetical protein
MKKNYKAIKMVVVLIALMTIKMSAQLNGLYTINSGSPSSTSNYTSFTALAADLNSLGVSGAVSVNVVANSGPYTEQVTFNSAIGASAANSIAINGNGNTITWSSASTLSGWTILLNSADFMSISNLTVTGTGSAAYVVMLVGGADNNTFNNVRMNCPANGTSSSQIPLVFSGANNTYASAANSANNNTFNNCTMFSGYFSFTHYGLTSGTFNFGNTFNNCDFVDWYVYGIYSYYARNLRITGCTIRRPTRSSLTTTYGLFATYNQGAIFERNRITNLFDGSPGFTGTLYAAYLNYNSLTGVGVQSNKFINNIIRVDNFNGFAYGLFSQYFNGDVDHNTVDFDNSNYNNTTTQYGIYNNNIATSYPLNLRNNIVTMKSPGTGTKYAYYCANTSGLTMSNNNIVNSVSNGTNTPTNQYHSYWNGNWYNQTQLATAGGNVNGAMLDPLYINPTSTVSTNYLPTNAALNNLGSAIGVTVDNNNQTRATVPDMGALEFLNTPCSGAPPLTSVIAPSAIQCPSVVLNLGFASAYTLANMSFQWLSSTTSSVGPFTAISGSTNQALTTPSTVVNTWYTASVTCLNGNQSINTNAGLVQIAGTTTNSVPYFEGFEGITGVNRLPNCSWSASNLNSTCLTYISTQLNNRLPRNGTKFASFFYNPSNTNAFYTNGIFLNAGVTYSASVWYTTEYYGYTNWTDLSILVGPNQSPTGGTVVATTNGAAISSAYKSLSNTFTVATSGLYYVAVRGTGNTSGSAQYLSWDDLAIEAPCTLNSTTLSVASSASVVCLGQPVTLTASGASSYTWSNGASGSSITVIPNGNTTYNVSGTSGLSGCIGNGSRAIIVNPSPIVSIFAGSGAVCKGSSINLTAFGATSYNWSNNLGNGSSAVAAPSSTTTYTVIGSNSFGCTASAVTQVNVNNLPTITIASPNTAMCVGESMNLIASGANTFTWNSPSNLIQGANVVVSPIISTSYTVLGTDANGCVGSSNFQLNVNLCLGLNDIITTGNGVKLYPNPTKSDLNIEFNNELNKVITVTDLTGRIVLSSNVNNKKTNLSLNNLASGVYYVKIESNNTSEVIKVVKQ